MRCVIGASVLAAVLLSAAAAQAEKRVFIIANSPDDYGVDRCLATGESCGQAAASSYCRSRQFARALSFHKIDRNDVTGAVPTSAAAPCKGGTCEDFVAIECAR